MGRHRLYRLSVEEGLALRRKWTRRDATAVHGAPHSPAGELNRVWSLDFVADELADGRRFRALTDNATIDMFNGRFRKGGLNVHSFGLIEAAQQKIDAFRWEYNEHRPYRALKGLSPREYAQSSVQQAADSPI